MTATASAPSEAAGKPGVRATLEKFCYDDQIVRMFMTASVIWGLVAFLVGLIIALQLVVPALNFGLPYLTFGRLRPLHTNAAIFAFAGNAVFCAVYYSTQRLCRTRMWSDTLSRLHFWGWQLVIVAAAITLPLGLTQGKEYAELQWPIDLLIAVVWLVFFGVNFFMTLKVRRERHLYVALWFYAATIITITVLHVFNNLVVPVGAFSSYPIYAGVQDAFMQWWYGHNAVGFFLTTPFLGLMYYFLPKAANRAVFSYRMSVIHFWALVFIYIWAGPHHLHYTALPEWSSTLGMVFSVMLIMPSWAGMLNGLLTLRGAWHKVTKDPVLKFFVVAVTFYGMSTFEGSMMSVKSVNALTHYTDWTIGHVHAGALGWVGFLTFGMIYWLLPRLFQAPLWSKKLANTHFWLATIGIVLYMVSMYIAGLTQGLMWRAIDGNGALLYQDFIETVRAILPMYWIRALGGTLYIAGSVLMAINYFKTWQGRPATYDVPEIEAPALTPDGFVDPEPPPSKIGHTLEIGKKIERFSSLAWHRKLERLPLRLGTATLAVVIVASLFEIVPMFLIRSNVPTIASVKPYTPLEVIGRDIYVREGCYNCHSQMIRPMIAETKRYGEYSKPGEFVYDRPFQWGSRRIGPDLAREGGRQSNLWHVYHFENPQEMREGSTMPSYTWLLEDDFDLKSLPRRMRALKSLGVPYSDYEMQNATQIAKDQAAGIAADVVKQGREGNLESKEVTALIAYLQRLGTDLTEGK